MKKMFFIVLLICITGCLFSCKKDELTVAIGKVDITTFQNEFDGPELVLRLFTSRKIKDCAVKSINSGATYSSRINGLSDFVYEISFDFSETTNFSQMVLSIEGTDYFFEIGSYAMNVSSSSEYHHLDISVVVAERYLETFSKEIITIDSVDYLYMTNLMKESIVVSEVKIVSEALSFSPEMKKSQSFYILSKEKKTFINQIQVPKSSNVETGYVIGVSYNYNGKNYQLLYNVRTNNTTTIEAVSSIVHSEGIRS